VTQTGSSSRSARRRLPPASLLPRVIWILCRAGAYFTLPSYVYLVLPSWSGAEPRVTAADLLFIVLFLAAVGTSIAALVAVLRGRRRAASTILRRLALSAGVYLTIVYAVALLSPPRRLALNEDACSDDWCMAIVGERRLPGAGGTTIEVSFRLSSRARRVSQRELGIIVYLRDIRGQRIEPLYESGEAPFDILLAPQQSVLTRRRFRLETADAPRALVVTRSGIPFPQCLILGEATGMIHPAELPLTAN